MKSIDILYLLVSTKRSRDLKSKLNIVSIVDKIHTDVLKSLSRSKHSISIP